MEEVKIVEANKIFSSDNLPKIHKRQRRKCNYKKINNQTRQKLIEMVYLKDFLLKDAAKCLGINYSTAKTILRIFRIEKRIEKKNADEERELKQIIFHFKNKNIHLESITKSQTQSENSNLVENKLKDRNADQANPRTITNIEDQKNSSLYKHNYDYVQAIYSVKDSIENFNQKINELSATVNICHGQIQNNQHMINNLINCMNNLRNFGKNGLIYSSLNSSIDKNYSIQYNSSPINIPFGHFLNAFETNQPKRTESSPTMENFEMFSKGINH